MQVLRMSHTDATKQPEAQAQPGAGPSFRVSKATDSVGGQWEGNRDPCGRQCAWGTVRGRDAANSLLLGTQGRRKHNCLWLNTLVP